MEDEDGEDLFDLDPVQVALQALFNLPQARVAIDKAQRLLDQVGNAIERGPTPRARPPQPQQQPHWATQPRRYVPDPLMIARKIMHFDAKEPLDKERISKRRRALAAACHPDQGGSTEAMMNINGAADALLASL